MHSARHNIFSSFRITVGRDEPQCPAKSGEKQKIVVVYARPAGNTQPTEEDMVLPHSDKEEIARSGSETTFYEGEDCWMWVLRLVEGVDVNGIEAGFQRVDSDSLYKMYVVRDYTKDDRTEAPEGIDQAEAEALS